MGGRRAMPPFLHDLHYKLEETSSYHMEKLINSLLSSADSEAFREPVDWRGLGLLDYPTTIKRPMDLGTVKLRLEQGAYQTAEQCAADVRLIWENCRTYNTGGVPRNLHRAADTLSKRFEARFAKLPAGGRLAIAAKGSGAGGGGGGDGGSSKRTKGGSSAKSGAAASPPPLTSEDRRRLARHLRRARMEDVTAAVHEIDRLCPKALVLRRGRRGDGGGGGHDDDDAGVGGVGAGDYAAALAGCAAIEIEVDVDVLDPWTFCAVERVLAPVAALKRATAAVRRTHKEKPVAGAVPGAASSSGGRSCGKGSRHHHQQQHEGKGVGATAKAAGEVGIGRGDEEGGVADVVAEAGTRAEASAAERRRHKKAKVETGASGASL